MLELMARGGMRIGEVLKLRLRDLKDRKLILEEPKSGREHEIVFIPQKVADRLREYALEVCKSPDDRIFPISYEGARVIVAKAGKLVGIKLRPHDLRRHSATYASRSGVPIEIVSKVILRHANLSTTQRYLGDHQRCGSYQVDREHLRVGRRGGLVGRVHPQSEWIRVGYLKNSAP